MNRIKEIQAIQSHLIVCNGKRYELKCSILQRTYGNCGSPNRTIILRRRGISTIAVLIIFHLYNLPFALNEKEFDVLKEHMQQFYREGPYKMDNVSGVVTRRCMSRRQILCVKCLNKMINSEKDLESSTNKRASTTKPKNTPPRKKKNKQKTTEVDSPSKNLERQVADVEFTGVTATVTADTITTTTVTTSSILVVDDGEARDKVVEEQSEPVLLDVVPENPSISKQNAEQETFSVSKKSARKSITEICSELTTKKLETQAAMEVGQQPKLPEATAVQLNSNDGNRLIEIIEQPLSKTEDGVEQKVNDLPSMELENVDIVAIP
ncbi:hypothetical protein D917_01510, partial [Trichinella nativa]